MTNDVPDVIVPAVGPAPVPAAVPAAEREARPDRDLVVDYLAWRDTPCPGCSFNLRGVNQGRCPECGLSLRLQVEGVGKLENAYLVGLMAWSLAFGACVAVIGTTLIQTAIELADGRFRVTLDLDREHVLPALVAAPFLLGAVTLWINYRFELRRRRGLCRTLAVVPALVLLGLIALWGFLH